MENALRARGYRWLLMLSQIEEKFAEERNHVVTTIPFVGGVKQKRVRQWR